MSDNADRPDEDGHEVFEYPPGHVEREAEDNPTPGFFRDIAEERITARLLAAEIAALTPETWGRIRPDEIRQNVQRLCTFVRLLVRPEPPLVVPIADLEPEPRKPDFICGNCGAFAYAHPIQDGMFKPHLYDRQHKQFYGQHTQCKPCVDGGGI